MKLIYTTRFLRAYKKLTLAQKEMADEAIRIFKKDPIAATLKNHALRGRLKGIRSIKAGYDLRLLYTEERGHTIVFFIEVGTHDQVY